MAKIVYMDVEAQSFHKVPIKKFPGAYEALILPSVHEWAEVQKNAGFSCGFIPNGPKTNGVNVRDEKLDGEFDKELMREMTETFESPDLSFQCSNLGIYVAAESTTELPNGKTRIAFDEDKNHGILNGGGTNHKILMMSQGVTNNLPADHDYVKVFVRTGLSKQAIVSMGKALNKGKSVTGQTMINAQEEYDWVKRRFEEMGTPQPMSFYMEEKDSENSAYLHRSDNLVSALSLFMRMPWKNSTELEPQDLPRFYCSGMKRVLREYSEAHNEISAEFYEIFPELCHLYDHIQATFVGMLPAEVLKNGESVYSFVVGSGKGVPRTFESPFVDREVYKIKKPIMMSAMWCMRGFLKKGSNGAYKWRVPFSDVLGFWDSYGTTFSVKPWVSILCDSRGARKLGLDAQKMTNEGKLWEDLASRMDNCLTDFKSKRSEGQQVTLGQQQASVTF